MKRGQSSCMMKVPSIFFKKALNSQHQNDNEDENKSLKVEIKFNRVKASPTLTPRLLSASSRSSTTSRSTTPSQLKPFVHLIRNPFVKPNCLSGKEKVKPSGSLSVWSLCSYNENRFWYWFIGNRKPTRLTLMKFAKHSAMWSNNCVPEPIIILWGMA